MTQTPKNDRVAYYNAKLGKDGKLDIGKPQYIDPRRCPHFIFVGNHYRADGSCKCNDPNATEMKDWGYVWNNGQWRSQDDE